MAAKAGEKAWQTGDFVCENCNEKVHVTEGETIPECPNCGNETYDTRRNEPGNS